METKDAKYVWKLKGFSKGIDPDMVVQELERIESLYGSLTPENVLQASEPEDAVLHKLFTWDNDLAAHQYRLQQARTIINNIEIKVISDGEPVRLPAFENILVNKERVYKSVQTFDKNDIEQVKIQTIRSLNEMKQKLSVYRQFDKFCKWLDEGFGLLE